MLDRATKSHLKARSGKRTGVRPPTKDVGVTMVAAGGDAVPQETIAAQPQIEPKEPRHGDPLYE